MKDKTVLVTGATNGIGKAAAFGLAKMGAHVVIAGRHLAKTTATVNEIKAVSGNHAVEMLVADLSSMSEVRALATQFKAKYARLDLLVNNAGGIFDSRRETADGYELTFALNHLSYFLLTNLLLDTLKSTQHARIINVASDTHARGQIDLNDLNSKRAYRLGGFGPYSASKLANVLFTYELARRLARTEITVNAVSPGLVASGFGHSNRGVMDVMLHIFQRFGRTPEKGAETILYLASSPEVAGVSGKYFEDCKSIESSPTSHDTTLARRLWEESARLTHLTQTV